MTTPGGSPVDLNSLVALAEREHLAGRFAEAAAAYRRILAIRPDIVEVHNNLGIILAQHGQLAEAAASFAQVIALKPNLPLAHYNLASVLSDLGRLDEAAAHFEHAIALRPDYPEAYNSLGNVLARQDQLDEAVARFQQAIACDPGFAEAHNNLGSVLWRQGKPDEAGLHVLRALALWPDYPEAHNNFGNLLAMQNQFAEAAVHFAQALALRPDYAEAQQNLNRALAECTAERADDGLERVLELAPDVAEVHHALGIILVQHGRLDEAAVRLSRAIALKPNLSDAHNNLGHVRRNQDLLGQAAVDSQRASAPQPNYELYNNLGVVLTQQGRLEEAIERFELALALKPDYAEAHCNLANVLVTQGKLDDAVAHYRQTLSVAPDLATAEVALGGCLLLQGELELGWAASEARLRLARANPLPNLPPWQGQPLTGRRLLLIAEEGLGDTLHFLRFARLLKARGARVVLAVQPALCRLLASHPDLDEVCPLGSSTQLPAADFYLPLLSAPGVLGTNLSNIPAEVPYLWADPGLVERWRQELAGVAGYKIGLAWQAEHEHRGYLWRSLPLADFAPLARLPGVQLLSLQKGAGSEQTRQVDFPVLDFGDRLDEAAGPFMDTAAVIRNLDLVVTIDTSIAHLAGALGAPVFVALPFDNDWRWLRDREDSPWYPSLRLFRQKTWRQWSEVVQRIAEAIQQRRQGC